MTHEETAEASAKFAREKSPEPTTSPELTAGERRANFQDVKGKQDPNPSDAPEEPAPSASPEGPAEGEVGVKDRGVVARIGPEIMA